MYVKIRSERRRKTEINLELRERKREKLLTFMFNRMKFWWFKKNDCHVQCDRFVRLSKASLVSKYNTIWWIFSVVFCDFCCCWQIHITNHLYKHRQEQNKTKNFWFDILVNKFRWVIFVRCLVFKLYRMISYRLCNSQVKICSSIKRAFKFLLSLSLFLF